MEFLIVGLVGIFVGASILRRHLREAKQLRLREIIHTERMKAMEHDTELPETTLDELATFLGDLDSSPPDDGPTAATGILWVRLTALCLGLTSLFGGIGTAIGLAGVSDPEANGMWSMGLIPVFGGIGLLLFYRLSRRHAEQTAIGTGE